MFCLAIIFQESGTSHETRDTAPESYESNASDASNGGAVNRIRCASYSRERNARMARVFERFLCKGGCVLVIRSATLARYAISCNVKNFRTSSFEDSGIGSRNHFECLSLTWTKAMNHQRLSIIIANLWNFNNSPILWRKCSIVLNFPLGRDLKKPQKRREGREAKSDLQICIGVGQSLNYELVAWFQMNLVRVFEFDIAEA